MNIRLSFLPFLLALTAALWLALHAWPYPVPDRASLAIAGYAGLQPFRPMTTPLWGALVQAVAAIPPLPLAATLCWLHVLIGAMIVFALSDTLIRLPYHHLSEQRRLTNSQSELLNAAAAIVGGGFLLASLPFTWAFRAPQPESLAWLSLALATNLLIRFVQGGRLRLLFVAFTLLGLGAVESASVGLAVPALAAPAFWGLWRRRLLSWRVVGGLVASSAIGLGLIFFGVWLYYSSPVAAWREIPTYYDALLLFLREYKAAGPEALPRQGWLLILAFALLPLALVFGKSAEGRADSSNQAGFLALRFVALPLVACTVLYEGPGSPMRASNHATLLLTPYMAAALWFGRLSGIALGWIAFPIPELYRTPQPRRGAAMFAAIFMITFLVIPLGLHKLQRAANVVSASQHLIESALGVAGEGGWLLSDGLLDSAVTIEARDRRVHVNVINVGALPQRAYQRFLQGGGDFPSLEWIEQVGLEIAVRDWLIERAGRERPFVAILARELYLPSPFAWQPTGAVFVARSHRGYDLETLRSALQEVRKIALGRSNSSDPGLAAASSWLSAYAARSANEIGVRLHAAGDLQFAREAFQLALSVQPDNLAALINDIETARALDEKVDDAAAANIKRRLAELPQGAVMMTLRARYGRIVHPGAARVESAEWAAYGFESRALDILRSEHADTVASAESRERQLHELLQQGDWTAAVAELDERLAEQPENLVGHIAKIRLLIADNRYNEAAAEIANWRARGWPRIAADVEEIRLLLARGQEDKADAFIRAAVAERPQDPTLRLMRAMLAERRGNVDAWREALAALEANTAGYVPGLVYLGMHAIRNRDVEAARRYFTASRAMKPGDRVILQGLLAVEMMTPGSPNRESVARALLQADPDNAAGWYAIGMAAAARGRWEIAADALQRAAQSAPSARTLNDLAWALHQLGRADDALAQAARACEAEPQNGFVWSTRGKIALDAGRYADAAQSFERAIENGHRPPSVELALLQAYIAQTNRSAAARLRADLEARAHMLSAAELKLLESIPNR